MNNLFYREKENWLLWAVWGIFGASFTAGLAIYSKSTQVSLIAISTIIILLTWQMAASKRFSFNRAFKVCFTVFSLSVSPLLFINSVNDGLFGDLQLGIQLGFFVVSGLVICMISAIFARTPPQYY